jgi:PEGA domain
MGSLLTIFLSGVVLLPTLLLTALITYAAVRGARKKYVSATSLVLESFTINHAAAPGEPIIHIFGRHKGFIYWILTNIGISNRVELAVTEKEWTLREGSLAGMLLVCVPLKKIRATICGYQRSILAFAFAVFFALNATWFLLSAVFIYLGASSRYTEAEWEHAATQASSDIYFTFGWLVACGIAVIIYHASKRVAFGVEAGQNCGIVFKRSFIEGTVIDLDEAEKATALLNRLVAAAVYDLPLAQIPTPSAPKPPAPEPRTLRAWMIACAYVGLVVLAAVLSWYGDGVTVQLSTVPVGAHVWMDNQYLGTTNNNAPVIVLRHTTREFHTLQAQSQGYQSFKQAVYVGGLESSQDVVVTMTLLNYPVTVTTTPGNSRVAVDGKDAGISNDAGLLAIPKVDRGNHQFSVSHDGFRTVNENVGIFGPHSFHIGLVTEAEAARQDAEARQREIAGHLDRGRMLFREGHYDEALAECDAVLKLDPSNAAAQALKKQIEQTRKIVG